MLVVPADARADLARLAEINLPVYLDRDLAECETITFQAGTHQDAISMRSEDFIRLAHPFVAPFGRDVQLLAGHL